MEALDFRVIMHDMKALIKRKYPQVGWENIIAGKSYIVVF